MNLLEMADEVLTRLGAATDDAALTVTIRKSFVNSALRAVEALLEHPYWLDTTANLTTIANVRSYAVPADWARSISLRLTASSVAIEQPLPFQANIPLYVIGSTTVRAWAVVGTSVILHPPPLQSSLVYEHRYTRMEPVLSADSATPLLPVRFHDAIVEKACTLAARRLGQYDRAAAHQKEFELLVPAILTEQERGWRPPKLWRSREAPK